MTTVLDGAFMTHRVEQVTPHEALFGVAVELVSRWQLDDIELGHAAAFQIVQENYPCDWSKKSHIARKVCQALGVRHTYGECRKER